MLINLQDSVKTKEQIEKENEVKLTTITFNNVKHDKRKDPATISIKVNVQ